jgi:flagellar M-ring protein FliF
MGFLNQSLAQIRELFASMTPAARITAALLVAVIGVSLGYLFQDYAAGGKEFLFNGEMMQPRDVDAMEAAIAKAKLSDYERQGNRIRVPRGKKSEYMGAIVDGGALPKNFDTLLSDELNSMSIFGDNKTRDARLKDTRERKISMLIRGMDGIAEAQVMYDIREQKGFAPARSTATVFVRPAADEGLTDRRAKMIRKAVAQAVAGLTIDDVAILNLADSTTLDSGGGLDPDAYDDPYFKVKTTFERQMKVKVEDVLRNIPGVRVQVTAELDETLASQTRTIEPKGDVQTVREQTDQTTQSSTQAEDRGRPGLTVQGPTGTPPDQAVAKNEQRTETNIRDADNWVPTTDTALSTAGLIPKHVRAAIAIPSDFLVRVWRERTPDAAADARPTDVDIQNIGNEYESSIKELVTPLFPREPAEDPYPNVQVTVFQSLTPEPVEPPTMLSETLMWASGNSGSLIMAGLALVSLVMLRSMMKSIPVSEMNVVLQTPAAALGRGDDDLGAHGEAAGGEGGGLTAGGGKSRPKLRIKKGPSLKDDLSEMVRDDPDAAASILRSWISSAG